MPMLKWNLSNMWHNRSCGLHNYYSTHKSPWTLKYSTVQRGWCYALWSSRYFTIPLTDKCEPWYGLSLVMNTWQWTVMKLVYPGNYGHAGVMRFKFQSLLLLVHQIQKHFSNTDMKYYITWLHTLTNSSPLNITF